MIYTSKDFLHEVAYNSTFFNEEQEFVYHNLSDYTLIDNNFISEDTFSNMILSLNDIIRVEKNTFFKIHKSYPSPRSLYPIKLFIARGDGTYLSKNEQTNQYEVYRNNSKSFAEGDILMEYGKEYPIYYKSIKKSLFLLEAGHLLYNLLFIAKSYGFRYKIKVTERYILLKLLSRDKNSSFLMDQLNLLMEKYTLRSSGPYLHPLTSFKMVPMSNETSNDENCDLAMENLCLQFEDSVEFTSMELIKLMNDDSGTFISSERNISVDYKQLNHIYPYINFKGVTGMFLFLLDNHVFAERNIISPYLLTLGFSAQYHCLLYAGVNQYCRPVKSFHIGEFEQILGIESEKSTIMYSLIIGTV